MLKEFKEFILTGNVVDFAVAVILAGAIGAVVNGFVEDIIMPVIGHYAGGMDFSQMKYVLSPASVGADGTEIAETAVRYGKWINTIISLITVGFVLFMIVKAYNKTRAPEAEEEAGPSDIDLLTEIRDLLKR